MDIRQQGGEWLLQDLWGFSRIPSEDIALPFAKAIMVCAYGDGRLAPEEQKWVLGYFCALGYSEAFLEALAQYDPAADAGDLSKLLENTPLTSDPDLRLPLIYNGVRAAAADRILDKGEVEALKRLAATIGIAGDAVEDIIAAYIAEVNAKMARIMICFPHGLPY